MSSKKGQSASKIRFLSFNANSIGKNPKRNQVLAFLKKKNPDFLVILDTRICPTIEDVIREEWGGNCFFSSFSSQSRGVAIFLKKGISAVILDQKTDSNGNLLALLFEYEKKKILLRGIYGPNEDSPLFYENDVFELIETWEPDFSIFVGDYNVTLNPELDNKNYVRDNNPQARLVLKNKINEHELVDIWRELNPLKKTYTWKKYKENKRGRLDYFLVSASLVPYVQEVDICSGAFSDHSVISVDIDFTRFVRGRGFWKLNTSLTRLH